MNERIKQLMTQASTIRYSGFGETEILDPEKFAELLIRECAELCAINDPEQAEILLEHFGVE